MQTKNSKTHNHHRITPRGRSVESWLMARYPAMSAATAKLLAHHAGYVRDEWAMFAPVAVEVVASVTKAIEVAHAG